MGLKNLNIKKWYDSDIDDILKDFYIPILSNSIIYKRLAGFFSSSILSVAAKGITPLIENGGTIELITSPNFQKDDLEIIKNEYETVENSTERVLLSELDNLENEFIRDHIRAFGWMLSNNLIKIKVAIITNMDGLPLDEKTIRSKGKKNIFFNLGAIIYLISFWLL